MQNPLQITIRDIPNSDALKTRIEQKAKKLEQFCDHIISCRVVIEVPQKHQHNGKIYNVRIDLTVPQNEIVVNKIKDENAGIAIRNAFDAAKRRLQNYSKKIRGEVKAHDMPTYGRIARLYPEEGIGFIQGMDGREFYFDRVNVAHPSYDQLEVGMEVQYLETTGAEGWQANRITLRNNNHQT